jgi:hypothetical protein
MPLISRKEYAELCGDRLDAINVWINKRGKVVTVADNKKLIDTDNPINAAFIQERQVFNTQKRMTSVPENAETVTKISKKVTKTQEIDQGIPEKKRGSPKKEAKSDVKLPKSSNFKAEKPVKSPVIPPVKAANTAEIRQKERVLAEQNIIAKAKMDQDYAKKALEIENLELAKQQKQLMLNKAAGELMPVDLVRGVLKRHADAINKNFEKGIVSLITIMVNIMAGGDNLMNVRFLGEAKEILSKNITNAGKQADEEIKILVTDFSQTLLRGQKRT